MKKLSIILFLSFLGISIFFSCKRDKNDTNNDSINVDTLNLPIKDSEFVIENEYTKIVRQLCENQEFSDLNYTNLNTKIYPIDSSNNLNQFIFASEVDCGYTPGNCGKKVQLLRKGSNGKYNVDFSFCGLIDSVAIDHPDKEQHIYYSTPYGRTFLVKWKNGKATSEQLTYNRMPVGDLNVIEEKTGIMVENLVKRGVETDNLDAIPVDYQQEKLSENSKLNIYNFEGLGEKYGFVFINSIQKNKKILGGKGKIVVKKGDNGKAIIEYTDENGMIKKWSFAANSQKFVPQ